MNLKKTLLSQVNFLTEMRFFMICGIISMLSRSKYFKGVGKETISILVIYKYKPSLAGI